MKGNWRGREEPRLYSFWHNPACWEPLQTAAVEDEAEVVEEFKKNKEDDND